MEDITDEDYVEYAKRVCKNFQIKNLGEYHDLYVQSDTLLLTDVFENFQNSCLEIYELADMQKLLANTWKVTIKIKNRHIFYIAMQIIYMDGSSK